MQMTSYAEAACRYAQQGRLENLRKVLSRLDSADINVEGKTCLHYAVINGHLDVVCFLLDSGKCDVNLATQNSKATSLKIARRKGHKEIARLLLRHGAQEESTNRSFSPKERGESLMDSFQNKKISIRLFRAEKLAQHSEELAHTFRRFGFAFLKFEENAWTLTGVKGLFSSLDRWFQLPDHEKTLVNTPDKRITYEHAKDSIVTPNGKHTINYCPTSSSPNGDQQYDKSEMEEEFEQVHSLMNQVATTTLQLLAKEATGDNSSLDCLLDKSNKANLSKSNLQSFFYLKGETKVSSVTHYDMNTLTIVIFDLRTDGLQALCPDLSEDNPSMMWYPIECMARRLGAQAVIFAGASLHRQTAGYYPALLHRVVASRTVDRNSVVFKLKPPPTCLLDSRRFIEKAMANHATLTSEKWWGLPLRCHWLSAKINSNRLGAHPFLAMDCNSGQSDPLHYSTFAEGCGEWYELRKRFGGEGNKFMGSEERSQAHAYMFGESFSPHLVGSHDGMHNSFSKQLQKCFTSAIFNEY